MNKKIAQLIADYFVALSHPVRIIILELLKEYGNLCVCQIVAMIEKDQSTISRHLAVMRKNGILECQSEGVRSVYSIKNKQILEILEKVKEILADNALQIKNIFSD